MGLKCDVQKGGYAFRAIPSASHVGMEAVPDTAHFGYENADSAQLPDYIDGRFPPKGQLEGDIKEEDRQKLTDTIKQMWATAPEQAKREVIFWLDQLHNRSASIRFSGGVPGVWKKIFEKLQEGPGVPVNWWAVWQKIYKGTVYSMDETVTLEKLIY